MSGISKERRGLVESPLARASDSKGNYSRIVGASSLVLTKLTTICFVSRSKTKYSPGFTKASWFKRKRAVPRSWTASKPHRIPTNVHSQKIESRRSQCGFIHFGLPRTVSAFSAPFRLTRTFRVIWQFSLVPQERCQYRYIAQFSFLLCMIY